MEGSDLSDLPWEAATGQCGAPVTQGSHSLLTRGEQVLPVKDAARPLAPGEGTEAPAVHMISQPGSSHADGDKQKRARPGVCAQPAAPSVLVRDLQGKRTNGVCVGEVCVRVRVQGGLSSARPQTRGG